MNRVIYILLSICGAVVCAFLAFFGYQQNQESHRSLEQAAPEYSCSELLDQFPSNTYSFSVTDFQPGKHFIHDDADGDGAWERVIVPVFPKGLKKLGRNYRAVILVISDTPNKDAVFEKMKSPSIEADYWFTSQTLDQYSYNRLAKKYSSLDFERSLVLYSGHEKSPSAFGKFLMFAALGGGLLSIVTLGWQSVSLVIAGIRSESSRLDDDDDEDQVITNRAGLPTKEEMMSGQSL